MTNEPSKTEEFLHVATNILSQRPDGSFMTFVTHNMVDNVNDLVAFSDDELLRMEYPVTLNDGSPGSRPVMAGVIAPIKWWTEVDPPDYSLFRLTKPELIVC